MAESFEVQIGPREIYDRLGDIGNKLDAHLTTQAVVNAGTDFRLRSLEDWRLDEKTTRSTVSNRAWVLWTSLVIAVVSAVANFLPIHH